MTKLLKKTSRRRGETLFAIAAVGALAWHFSRADDPPETVSAVRGDVEDNVTAVGTLQPLSYVDVGAQVSGQIQRIHVKAGSIVKKDQLLAEIDPSVQQAEVDANRAALAGLKAQLAEQQALLELAEQQSERQTRMAAEGSTRDEDVQTAKANLRSALARIDNLQAQIEQTQSQLKADLARLGYTRIFAPMAGTVVSLEAREGQTLNATQQAPVILRIADLSTMTVWTDVSEADIKRIKPDMPVYFTTLGMDERAWNGKVRQILPAPAGTISSASSQPASASAATGKVVLYTVLFDVDNPDGELMPQMTAQVFFVVARRKDVLTLPLSALQIIPGKRGTYSAQVLQANGEIVDRQVKIGISDRVIGEVLSGVGHDEKIVLAKMEPDPAAERRGW
jgi:macrolide-specific efflux system membrane fusion protein